MRSILLRIAYDISSTAAALLIVTAFMLAIRHGMASEPDPRDPEAILRILAAFACIVALLVFLRKKQEPQPVTHVYRSETEPMVSDITDRVSQAESAEIVVCAGPPKCNLEGDEAVENQKAGCPLCERIIINPDGTETRSSAPKH